MSHSKDEIKIPITDEFAEILRNKIRNGHILENLLFPEAQDISPYEHMKEMVEIMENVGVRKQLIYAFIKTERMVTKENLKYLTSEDLDEWNNAIDQYKKLINSKAILPSDSLIPFIQASKEIPNPHIDKEELKILFETRFLHPIVIDVSYKQFINNDFPSAIFNVYKKLLATIQEKSGNYKEDGLPLITSTFNPKNPIIFSSLAVAAEDSSIQEGIMHLFMDSVLCVRNIFAHKDVYLTDPIDALDYLSYASFLYKILDGMSVSNEIKKTSKRRGN